MKSQVLHTVWCHISFEAAGEFWHWSLSGVKGLIGQQNVTASAQNARFSDPRPRLVSVQLASELDVDSVLSGRLSFLAVLPGDIFQVSLLSRYSSISVNTVLSGLSTRKCTSACRWVPCSWEATDTWTFSSPRWSNCQGMLWPYGPWIGEKSNWANRTTFLSGTAIALLNDDYIHVV